MKTLIQYIIIIMLYCIKGVCAMLLWNYVILRMLKFETLSIGQALIGALCIQLIILKVKFNDKRRKKKNPY